MDSTSSSVHFALIPLMAQGHMIPMIDIGRIFARRGVIVTIYTTPINASRFKSVLNRAAESGMPIRLVEIPFPCEEVGLPAGYENLDILPSPDFLRNFYAGLSMMQEPIERHIESQNPPPSCIISDRNLYWTSDIARKFGIPRIIFHGMGCFALLSSHNVKRHNAHLSVSSDHEPFEVPGMPNNIRVRIAKTQLPGRFVAQFDFDDYRAKIQEAERQADGVLANSYDALEVGCVEEYAKAINKRIWSIGPVSLSNDTNLDRLQRGKGISIDTIKECVGWLDTMKPRSVIYACLGSLCRLISAQIIELGKALAASGKPFIWVIKAEGDGSAEMEKWLLEENFEERTKGRGYLIRGWAPQVAILSHEAIGGFITHCGWNSTMEGVSFGLPMITWPLHAEQFFNEILVVDVLRIGVRVGVKIPARWGEEEKVGVLVKEDEILGVVNMLMCEDEKGEERRKRAFQLGEEAKRAIQDGGTSHSNVSNFIHHIIMKFKS